MPKEYLPPGVELEDGFDCKPIPSLDDNAPDSAPEYQLPFPPASALAETPRPAQPLPQADSGSVSST